MSIDPIGVYEWIVGISNSCNNQFHIDSLDKLIELYIQKFPEEEDRHTQLQTQREQKFNEIHSILK